MFDSKVHSVSVVSRDDTFVTDEGISRQFKVYTLILDGIEVRIRPYDTTSKSFIDKFIESVNSQKSSLGA